MIHRNRNAPRPRRVVAPPSVGSSTHDALHDLQTRRAQAERIAALLDLPLGDAASADGDAYLIPADTLDDAQARLWNIVDESQIYGGVAPFAFVASKAVSHGLVGADAIAPQGWANDLGRALSSVVLAGFTTFSVTDARSAALQLLEVGPARLKDVNATAGLGQTVVHTLDGLDAALRSRDPSVIARDGLVIEENLIEPQTLSVGTTVIGNIRIAYWGVQRLVRTAQGDEVYGGSDLQVALGDYEALLAFDLPREARTAIALARTYETEIFSAYPGLFASRRNYDVILGRDINGRPHGGVLEQSWRIGGASGAEIAAIEAFRRDQTLRLVRSQTMEVRSADAPVPADATVYFQGVDPQAGPLTKYARRVG